MSRPSPRTLLSVLLSATRRTLVVGFAAVVALAAAGCGSGVGEGGLKLSQDDPLYEGARIFNQRCAGCHTLDAAAAEGSASRVDSSEYKDGPSFNDRKEEYEDVIYAIQNGGFSSGPMPQNIVTGREAEMVACFLANYSGAEAQRQEDEQLKQAPEGAGGGDDDCRQRLASR